MTFKKKKTDLLQITQEIIKELQFCSVSEAIDNLSEVVDAFYHELQKAAELENADPDENYSELFEDDDIIGELQGVLQLSKRLVRTCGAKSNKLDVIFFNTAAKEKQFLELVSQTPKYTRQLFLRLVEVYSERQTEDIPNISSPNFQPDLFFCLQILQEYKENKGVQKEVLSLFGYAWTAKVLINHGFARAIYKSMFATMDFPSACKNVCKSLAELSWKSHALREELINVNILEPVDQILTQHSTNKLVLSNCFQAISSLVERGSKQTLVMNSRNNELSEGINSLIRLKIHEKIVMHIKSANECDMVYLTALRSLGSIAKANKFAVEELSKVIPLHHVIQKMQDEVTNSRLQILSCRLLASLDFEYSNWKINHIQNAMIATVQAMDTHQTNKSVQTIACHFLCSLSILSNSVTLDMIKLDALSRIVTAMEKNASSAKVQEAGCSIISNIALTKDVGNILIESSAVSALTNGMLKWKTSKNIQCTGCQALLRISKNSPSCVEELFEPKSVFLSIVTALKNYKEDANIQLAGCETLSIASKDAAYTKYFCEYRLGLLAIMKYALENHPDNEQVKLQASTGYENIKAVDFVRIRRVRKKQKEAIKRANL